MATQYVVERTVYNNPNSRYKHMSWVSKFAYKSYPLNCVKYKNSYEIRMKQIK